MFYPRIPAAWMTIILKETPASQLFERLNSYSHQHPLYKALKEFGQIIETMFILRYVDEPGDPSGGRERAQ